MDGHLFTLKCRIYRLEVRRLVADGVGSQTCAPIPRLINPPIVQLNSAESQLYNFIFNVPSDFTKFPQNLQERKAFAADNSSAYNDLCDLLNSLSNRLLFLTLVEYQSWFPQNEARAQMAAIVRRAIWPVEPPSDFRVVVQFVEDFVSQRARNFRDVISRVCKRELGILKQQQEAAEAKQPAGEPRIVHDRLAFRETSRTASEDATSPEDSPTTAGTEAESQKPIKADISAVSADHND